MAHLVIKASTPDDEIVSKLSNEEILAKFADAKGYSTRWDAERDRLRKFIQEHMDSGRYGKFILEKKDGTARVYASSEGNKFIQCGLMIDMGLLSKPLKDGTGVVVVDAETNEELTSGIVVGNNRLYSKKPPINIKLTEIPDEDSLQA